MIAEVIQIGIARESLLKKALDSIFQELKSETIVDLITVMCRNIRDDRASPTQEVTPYWTINDLRSVVDFECADRIMSDLFALQYGTLICNLLDETAPASVTKNINDRASVFIALESEKHPEIPVEAFNTFVNEHKQHTYLIDHLVENQLIERKDAYYSNLREQGALTVKKCRNTKFKEPNQYDCKQL